MSMTKEGTYPAQINDIALTAPRFEETPADGFEIKIDFVTQDGETGEIYLEFSSRSVGKGAHAAKTRFQRSMEELCSIGWQGGVDFSRIEVMKGRAFSVYSKKNDKGYFNAYISGGMEARKLTPQEVAAKVAQLTGQQPMQVQQPYQPQPVQQPVQQFGPQPMGQPYPQPVQQFSQNTQPFGQQPMQQAPMQMQPPMQQRPNNPFGQ